MKSSNTRELETLSTMATAIVPEVTSLARDEKDKMMEIMSNALSRLPHGVKRRFRLFLRAMTVLALLRYGHGLKTLDESKKKRLLNWLQGSSVPNLRKGFWGLKTFIFMGYYGRPQVGREIHYCPSNKGNELLRKRG